jgi:hypothetical protein
MTLSSVVTHAHTRMRTHVFPHSNTQTLHPKHWTISLCPVYRNPASAMAYLSGRSFIDQFLNDCSLYSYCIISEWVKNETYRDLLPVSCIVSNIGSRCIVRQNEFEIERPYLYTRYTRANGVTMTRGLSTNQKPLYRTCPDMFRPMTRLTYHPLLPDIHAPMASL